MAEAFGAADSRARLVVLVVVVPCVAVGYGSARTACTSTCSRPSLPSARGLCPSWCVLIVFVCQHTGAWGPCELGVTTCCAWAVAGVHPRRRVRRGLHLHGLLPGTGLGSGGPCRRGDPAVPSWRARVWRGGGGMVSLQALPTGHARRGGGCFYCRRLPLAAAAHELVSTPVCTGLLLVCCSCAQIRWVGPAALAKQQQLHW